MSAKTILRREIAKRLAKVDTKSIELQSGQAAEALRDHALYEKSRNIAFYMHMDAGELQTSRMIRNAFADGKRVYLPHIARYGAEEHHPWYPAQKTHLRILELPDLASVDALAPRGKYKLREPTSGLDCLGPDGSGLDLIVLPGVAFTKDGRRLGHGAGFYDSFVAEHEARGRATPRLLGVGLAEQLVDPPSQLPCADHDRRLDAVILAGAVYDAR